MPITHDASFVDSLPANVAVQFLERVDRTPDREAFRHPVGESWESLTWAQTGQEVSRLAGGLLSLGLQPEERVGIASGTRYEWILADLAIMCAAGATTTVYPTTNEEDTAYILADSECRVIFAEDDDQVAKLRARKSELPHVVKVVTFTGETDGDWVIDLEGLAALGDAHLAQHPGVIEETARAIPGDQLATLIYTSGTTGRPKGVRLRHSSWVYEGGAIKAQGILSEDDLQFLWLPMAHSFGKVLLSTQLACGFATAVDGRVERIVDNCASVKPTFMGAAPRIFEKAYGRIQTMQAAEGGAKEKIFHQAFAVGLKVEELKREGKSVPLPLKLQHGLFDRLVFSKVRERFGGRVRFFISGAAALNREIAEWFNAAGIVILEGYGMTENSAGATVNHPDDNKIGTVGRAMPGSEVKIGEGDEVLLRGPQSWTATTTSPRRRPQRSTPTAGSTPATRARSTRRASCDHRPDQGALQDVRRQVHRPAAIESKFEAICPYASQFIVFGAERNFCVALVTLDPDAIAGCGAGERRLRRLHRHRALEEVQGDGRGLRRGAQQPPQPVGDHQEVGAARPRPQPRVR